MYINALLSEERAVSPVIAVVLMVAMTVILAAVIGTFALGFSERIGEPMPLVQFDHEYDSAGKNVTITHDGGNSARANQLSVHVSGAGQEPWFAGDTAAAPADPVRVGHSFETGETSLSGAVESGETLRVNWSASSGGNTATLYSREL